MRKPSGGLSCRLQLQGGVYMCAPLHHRNKPTIHLIMIVLSSPACIRAIMNAFMFHIGAAHNYTRVIIHSKSLLYPLMQCIRSTKA